MLFTRWTFYDPNTLESYTVPINPDSVTDPSRKKNIVEQPTVAPNGALLLVEGRDQALVKQFSGTILTKEHHEAFNTWFEKRYPVRLTDDNGDQEWIYITEYSPKRVRSASRPYKRTFQVSAYVLPGNPYA